MRVYCTACGGKARIGSREEVSPLFTKLYCGCLDVNCGHTFVLNLSFSHSLRPAAQTVDQLLFDRLRELPLAQQRELFDQLSALP
ncbi:ogr/Delta-like zinc finger family protein [Azotobacter vinelandii]|uniref:ogr/Delta-like zinc finger family protein n=1 Tax=Azotobacter vinelandii TaxID=354 RepID=UPI000774323D|nr:ogr/Delta-like zinc finger family protein [Azotobacter vinelandii]WKN21483.1 ogr/Delta-like zinc finger family protein [Azotobacter vinelandii]